MIMFYLKMSPIAQQLQEEGRAKGVEEGRVEGKIEVAERLLGSQKTLVIRT